MMKSIVVYWSMSGNTESIAERIGADVSAQVKKVGDTSVDEVLQFDTIILGCPAMGAEELEDSEFRPFYEELIGSVGNKRIFLFGSYGWGDGEWMRLWQEETVNAGANLIADGLIVNGDISAVDEEAYQNFINKILS